MANSSLLSGLVNINGSCVSVGASNYHQTGNYQQGNLVPATITTTQGVNYIGGQSIQTINIPSASSSYYSYKQPKNGDIKMDADSFNFYVYEEELGGWIPCEIESTKKERDGKGDVKSSSVVLVHDMSIIQMKKENENRNVLFEKFKPAKINFVNGSCITTAGTSITIAPNINWQINPDNQITYKHDYVFNDLNYNQTIGVSSRGYETAVGTVTNSCHSASNISNYNSC